MRQLYKILSLLGLLLTIGPSVFYFKGEISLSVNHTIMAVGMLLWFITAPLWINDKINKEEGRS